MQFKTPIVTGFFWGSFVFEGLKQGGLRFFGSEVESRRMKRSSQTASS